MRKTFVSSCCASPTITRKRGSILIWTVFLSLFVAVFFVTFQSRLGVYFAQTENTETIYQENLTLQQALENLRQKPQSRVILSETKNLVSTDFDGSEYIFSLPTGYATEFRITNTG